jgi:hypothetical protein
MELKDGRGHPLNEVIVMLSNEEVTELLVATSQLDGTDADHALLRTPEGTTLAIYRAADREPELARGTDWWMGPLVLVAVLFLVVGAYTIARGVLGLIF